MEAARRKEDKPLMVIWGDCIPLPCGSERISYDSTYAGLLQKALPSWDIINRAVPKLTASRQLTMIQNDLKFLDPDLSIIHSGVADLFPHLVYQTFRVNIPPMNMVISRVQNLHSKLLDRIWLNHITFLARARMHKHEILKLPIIQYTPLNAFQKHFKSILALLKTKRTNIIVIGLAKPKKYLKNKVPEINSLVSAFNDTLKGLSKRHRAVYIDCWKLGNHKFLQEDSIHLSVFGHKAIFNQIYDYCVECFPFATEESPTETEYPPSHPDQASYSL